MSRITPFQEHSDQYEAWFEQYPFVYQSEVEAVRALLPQNKNGIEIGVGSGRFAAPLGITAGVDPSATMRALAEQRGIHTIEGEAEALPLDDWQFDFALMVTTICFLDDVEVAFTEVRRILKPGGQFIIGLVDAESPLGRVYQQMKEQDVFYREATFYSLEQVLDYLKRTDFHSFSFRQTIFQPLDEIKEVEPVKDGYGEGSFVVIHAVR